MVVTRLLAATAALAMLAGCASLRGARLYSSGSQALERGDVASAVADLESAAGLLPHASEVYNHLGLAYQAAGRFADARQAFERSTALDCDNAAAAENLRAFRAMHPGPVSSADAAP